MLSGCHLKHWSIIVETLVSVRPRSPILIDVLPICKKQMLVATLVKEKRITHRANLDTSVEKV